MKKILLLSVLFIFYFNNSESGIKSYYDGSGPLKISNEVAKNFSDYVKKTLKGKMGDKPVTFWVTEDGNNSYWWTTDGNSCERTWDNEIYIVSRQGIITFGVADMCRGRQHIEKFGDECESYYNMECKIFAKERIITWDNGINPGRGKQSKFNSRWSEQKIFAKLNELGFSFQQSKKVTKTQNTETVSDEANELLDNLKTLKELYDTGALTEEEFQKAKKTLLSK